MYYKCAGVLKKEVEWLCAKKHNTHFVGVFAQAQRKSYMGTKYNDKPQNLTTSCEFVIP